jgi:small subunit ribosomal protein S2
LAVDDGRGGINPNPILMPRIAIEELLRSGAHFGHLTSRWNPKMASYIFMERNGIHIIDLKQTQAMLDLAADAVGRFASRGKKILFVGTKKQAQEVIRTEAQRAGMPYVTDRWLGGMLTNFQTIRRSIRRMETIQRQEADGSLAQLKKKERLMRRREREKLERVLGGISEMNRLPGAIFVVDVRREHIAVSEARKLNIPIIALADTNCDPDLVDFPIAANDDAVKSVALFTRVIADAILEGSRAGEIEREAAQVEAETRKAEAKEMAEEKAAEKAAAKFAEKAKAAEIEATPAATPEVAPAEGTPLEASAEQADA